MSFVWGTDTNSRLSVGLVYTKRIPNVKKDCQKVFFYRVTTATELTIGLSTVAISAFVFLGGKEMTYPCFTQSRLTLTKSTTKTYGNHFCRGQFN